MVTELFTRLPASLELTLAALTLSLLIAVPLGVLAATRPDTWVDHLCRFVVTAGVSLPTFFTGLALLYVFYYLLGWAPAPLGRLDIIVLPPPALPASTQSTRFSGRLRDVPRSTGAAHVAGDDTGTLHARPNRPHDARIDAPSAGIRFRTHRTSGRLPGRTVLFTYAFRNALLPVVTTLGMVFSFTLGANVLVEKVFAWPGIGSYAIEALTVSDYAAVQGFVLAMAILFVALNLLIDIAYTLIDRGSPRRLDHACPIGTDGSAPPPLPPAAQIVARARSLRAGFDPVTLFAFSLLLLILTAALIGPYIVPYDPLATLPAKTQAAVMAALVRHRSTRSRHLLARGRCRAPRSHAVGCRGGAVVRDRLRARLGRGLLRRLGSRPSSAASAIRSCVSAVRARDGIVAALGNTIENIIYATAIINLPFYARMARAR